MNSSCVVNGLRLSYRDVGKGPVVLLLHGLGASMSDWDEVVPLLSQQYRVITPDLRGHGDSERSKRRYQPDGFADDIEALLAAIGIEDYVVVGHSMGGAVALTLALRQPQGLRGLVIANSVPGFNPRRLREHLEVWLRFGTMALLGPAALGRIMARRLFPSPEQQEERARVERRAARNSRYVYLASLYGLTRWSAEDRLAEVRIPTLIIAAGRDYFRVEDVEAYARGIRDAEFHLLPEARHGVPIEAAEQLSSILLGFLQARCLPPTAQPIAV
jgi:3-oxoadipate enol-lactonase